MSYGGRSYVSQYSAISTPGSYHTPSSHGPHDDEELQRAHSPSLDFDQQQQQQQEEVRATTIMLGKMARPPSATAASHSPSLPSASATRSNLSHLFQAEHQPSDTTPLLPMQRQHDTDNQHGAVSVLQDKIPPAPMSHYSPSLPPRTDDGPRKLDISPAQVVRGLPAVLLGLILNLLDAMSYGYILFPIADAAFADFGSDGISMYLVSTIVAQLVYSSMSQFKGGNGSMMIEVIPFMHIMARIIQKSASQAEFVLPTIMLAYALSAVMTALFFFLLGAFRLGNMMGFFPRHILVGSIGGVGYFLLQTAVEVTGRIKLHLSMHTLHKLFKSSVFPLWSSALGVALILRLLLTIPSRRLAFVHSPLFVPCFFMAVPAVFYVIVAIVGYPLDELRQHGWLFDIPEGKPFYQFYTYYDFANVEWSLLPSLLPTMLSLSFFSVLHVPINVPALAVSINADVTVTRELLAHAASNALSACFGSIQNYLVYSNSVLFYRSGGDTRIAGFLLAAATAGVWVSGTVVFRLIPTVVVGSLIFHLGIDLVKEALWDPVGVVTWIEYGTIWSIVIAMAFLGFTEGIGVGIILACLFFVVTYSNRSIIRAEVTGDTVRSTVRRMYRQQRFLNDVGDQIHILQMQGFIFFGTIYQLDKKIKRLFPANSTSPIRYLILDLHLCQDIDFSAGEAFVKIIRKVNERGVVLIFSGVDSHSHIGTALYRSGVLSTAVVASTRDEVDSLSDDGSGVASSEAEDGVRSFATLNNALEWCENQLIEMLYTLTGDDMSMSTSVNIPGPLTGSPPALAYDSPAASSTAAVAVKQLAVPSFAAYGVSPRREMLVQAASNIAHQECERSLSYPTDASSPSAHPHAYLRNLIFELAVVKQDRTSTTANLIPLSSGIEDPHALFVRILPYLEYKTFTAGERIWRAGEPADAVVIVEEGVLTATLDADTTTAAATDSSSTPPCLPLQETILPGTMIGEMMFLCNQPHCTDLAVASSSSSSGSAASANGRAPSLPPSTGCAVWLFRRQRLHDMATQDPELMLTFLQLILTYSHEWDNTRRNGHGALLHGNML
ncbi:hypothetical protein RI367_006795 [Sorochytrium milnesiophthora]